MELHSIVGAYEIINIGGKSYKACPLSIADIGAINKWSIEEPIDEVRKILISGDPFVDLETTHEKMRLAIEKSMKNLEDPASMAQMLETYTGATNVVRLSLSHFHSNVEIDEVFTSINKDSLLALASKVLNLSGLLDLEIDVEKLKELTAEALNDKLGKVSMEPSVE